MKVVLIAPLAAERIADIRAVDASLDVEVAWDLFGRVLHNAVLMPPGCRKYVGRDITRRQWAGGCPTLQGTRHARYRHSAVSRVSGARGSALPSVGASGGAG